MATRETAGAGPEASTRASTPCGAASTKLAAAAAALGCRRNPCAKPLLQLGAGPLGGGRVCACVTALPARAEAKQLLDVRELDVWTLGDSSRVTVRDTL